MTTEPSAGSAPPLSPVPAPRATKGMLVFRADANYGLDLLSSTREGNRCRHDTEGGETVALVGLELVGRGDEAGLGGVSVSAGRMDGGAKFGEDGRCQHGSRALLPRCYPKWRWTNLRAQFMRRCAYSNTSKPTMTARKML